MTPPRLQRALIAVGLSLIAVSCLSHKPSTVVQPFSAQKRAELLKRAKTPETFGLTVYRTDDGPVFAGAHRVPPDRYLSVAFAEDAKGAFPLITASQSRRQSLRILVDTSSADNWCTLGVAELLGGIPMGPPGYGRKADHIRDDIGGMLYHGWQMRLDDQEIASPLLYVRAAHGPMGALARWSGPPDPDLILGMAGLKAFACIELDFPGRRIRFSSSTPIEPDADRLIATAPLAYHQGALACDGILDGRPARFILDTAGDFSLTMKDPAAAMMKQLSIGDLVLRKIQTESSVDRGLGLEDYPRIGHHLLKRYVVTLDLRGRRIHFSRPPLP